MTKLHPSESMILAMAKDQIARGHDPEPNTVAFLIATIDRLESGLEFEDFWRQYDS